MNIQTLATCPYQFGAPAGSPDDPGFLLQYGTGSVEAGETSDAITGFLGKSSAHVAVTKGTVEYTISPISAIEADTAVWIPWPYGEVSSNTADVVDPGVIAFRITAPAGAACTWEIRG